MPIGGTALTRRRTIANVFDSQSNSLNAIRLALAVAVIVSHSWALGGFGPEPEAGGARLGTWAVLGFFGISGFLITRSRLSGQSAVSYYRGRVLRIFPAFLVCLFIVALLLAPLSLAFDAQASWSPVDSVRYIARNIALYPPVIEQPAIGETLQHVPLQGYWNGSLWTLFWEASCYVLLGVAGSLLSRRGLKIAVVVIFAATTVLAVVGEAGLTHYPDLLARVLPLFAIFSAGAGVFLFADRVRVNVVTVAVAVLVLAAVVALGMVQSLGTLPLIFLIMLLGQALHLPDVGRRRDISYGVYIYAWPVQQLVILIGGDRVTLLIEIVASLAITAGLAYLSCRFIEQPALRLKRRHV